MKIVIVLVIIIVLYFLYCFNKLIKANNQVKEAFSTMDVYLKKRWDLIPNIVEIVKGYANYEKNTLEEIVKLRNRAYDDMNNNEKVSTNTEITSKLSRLMALAEKYPDLKANEQFKNLSQELVKVEEDIANTRKYFNATVRDFNNKVEMFPSNVVAKVFGYKSKSMFKTNEEEKNNIRVEL